MNLIIELLIHFILKVKKIFNFQKCITEIIDFYKTKDNYKEKDSNITQALYRWTNNNDIFELINVNDYENILHEYKNLKKKHEEITEIFDINLNNSEYKYDNYVDELFSRAISDSSPNNIYYTSISEKNHLLARIIHMRIMIMI